MFFFFFPLFFPQYVDLFHLDFFFFFQFFIVFPSPLPLPIPVLRFSGMFLEVSKEINVS